METTATWEFGRARVTVISEGTGWLPIDRAISDVPGVSFIPAPGESPGHAIVRVEGGAEIVYLLGDLFHYPAEFRHFNWMPSFRDRAALIASRKKFVPRFVAENAWLIPAHHLFPAIGRVEVADDGGYRWVKK